MERTIITKDSNDTEKAGEDFIRRLKPQDVVFLIGELGSGKTTFTKGVARGLGITTRIISPTFVIMRTHKVPSRPENPNKITTLYHLDLYRLQTKQQTANVGIEDILDDTAGITFIEWPEISQQLVRKRVWKVIFKVLGDTKREIKILNS
jgi:tRNA threonylcarbamoyladenosine biosynthesis protein TsaE